MPPKGSKIVSTRTENTIPIERDEASKEFMKKLAEYHEKRGTTLDAEPKIGPRLLDLAKLYERVIGEGGYDLVSDTKARPLMWRKLAEEFLGKSPHLAAQAFQVKSAYYKNLAAYEITNHWHREPPPRIILEDLTAKGGGIMDRTLDNFLRSSNREAGKLGDAQDSDSDDGEEKTPKQEKMEVDEPGSAHGRSTRGLRQAPPQRVLFQPDLAPSRQSRTASNHLPSLSPGDTAVNGTMSTSSYLTNGTNTTLANYEPRPQYPLTLKPVITPANNPEHYRLKRKQLQDASASQVAKRSKGIMLPGTGFIGPNIYVRAQLALQSGLPEEEEYALHHLVKISHERGDKYRFDQFPGLAEALISKVLKVSNLFYDVDWSVSYDEHASFEHGCVLDGTYGTADLLKKLKSRVPFDTDGDVQDLDFTQALGRIAEAGLVIRNMVMLEENAQYVAKMPLLKDYFSIVLGLKHPGVVELQHYALETAEQVSKYYQIDSQDSFYQLLLDQLDGGDRGKIVTSLRTVSRLGMIFPENKRLEDVPIHVLDNVCSWMMMEDEELRSASLDFLFQFTSIADNVEVLTREINVPALVRQLARLLLYNAKEDVRKDRNAPKKREEEPQQPTQVPRLAKELVEQLLKHEEPERSSHWLRMCFQDDPAGEMTQLHLWQSYQGTFLPYTATHPHLIAGDFIKNVSSTFTGASAQVAGANRYVIRGIKPRATPVDYRGRELARCCWRSLTPDTELCGEYFPNSVAILEHTLSHHLKIPRKRPTPAVEPTADGKPSHPASNSTISRFDFSAVDTAQRFACRWSTCTRSFASEHASNPALQGALLARHIVTHLPDATPTASWKNRHHRSVDAAQEAPKPDRRVWLNTMTDERNDAAGLPLGCMLVMRNIARGLPRIAARAADGAEPSSEAGGELDGSDAVEESGLADDGGVRKREPASQLLMREVFEPVKETLFYAVAHNYVLKDYLGSLLKAIARGGG